MSHQRTLLKIVPSTPQMEGAGVLIRRTIGTRSLDYFDPFLLLDEFNTEKPEDYIAGFPDHPHRGFETVSYLLEGSLLHEDHKGNKGLLGPGAVQWMTAGRGIVHSEMPQQKDGKLHGFQMWVNLPKKDKMVPPRYQDFQKDQIPVVKTNSGVEVKIMAGESQGVKGAVSGIATSPLYLDISVPPSTTFVHPVDPEHNAWCYVIDGVGFFGKDSEKVEKSTLALTKMDGNEITVTTKTSAVRFLLASARPLLEPMERYGPFVMNTKAELYQAFEDFQNGKLQQ